MSKEFNIKSEFVANRIAAFEKKLKNEEVRIRRSSVALDSHPIGARFDPLAFPSLMVPSGGETDVKLGFSLSALRCSCIERTCYALQLANIPVKIFQKFICPLHSKASDSNSNSYIQCLLHHDALILGSEDMNSWETTYHGGPVPTMQSILHHGELLMEEDVLCDGAYLESAKQKSKDQKPAIWTFPKLEGADNRTELATYDEGETSFKALLELRQRSGTFTKHQTGWGYEIYATDRRGTINLWALHIQVIKSKSEVKYQNVQGQLRPQIGPKPKAQSTCNVLVEALEALESLKIPSGILDKRFDRCYCSSCFLDLLPYSKVLSGEKFIEPRGWVKFGIKVNEGFARMNDVWDFWNSAFHGCAPSKVLSILKHRSLLIPGDQLYDGTQIDVNSSVDVNQNCYFFSPTVVYSSHPWYAQFQQIGEKYFQTVLLFKVRPGSFDKQKETEGGDMVMFDDYSILDEDEIEWCSSRRGCSMPCGILVRVVSKEEFEIFNHLAHAHPDTKSFRLKK